MTIYPDPARVAAIMRTVAHEEIMPRFNRLESHETSKKKSGEIVTAADLASEKRLVAAFTDMLPGCAVVGEEGYAADEKVIDCLGGDAPVWIIDPLDGTRNFADGRPCFAVIVALALRGETQMGWIYDPINDLMMSAVKGEGVWEGGERCWLAAVQHPIASLRGSIGKRPKERLEKEARDKGLIIPKEMIRYQCVGREYMDLARGRLDFAVYGALKPWDHAAGVLFYHEAGGFSAFHRDIERDYHPGPIADERFILAPDRTSWTELRDLLQRHFPPGS
jgi:fructose-1,6-bisphosphatase/inositol monophosphatase family enzyme